MAALESLRVMLSARSFLRLGSAVPSRWIPAVSSTPLQEVKDELFLNFRHLTLSPAEACLSSQLIASERPHTTTTECRLPPLLKPATITVPTLYNGLVFEKNFPSEFSTLEKNEPIGPQQAVEVPPLQIVEKQAARLIVIRRKKMKKHKLKKLRKRMKFAWLKVRQKREYKKEKLFQATQMAKLRKHESFDAANYVTDVLRCTKEKPIPRTWKGKRLPEFLIKELIEKEKLQKIKNKKECLEREELKKIKNSFESKL